MTWKRGTFSVHVHARWHEIDNGIRTGHTSGPFGIQSKTWHITHIPSGLKLSDSANTFAEAKKVVNQLLPLADWISADPLSRITEETRLAIRQACVPVR
jgi:hypothetical protein